MEATNIGEVMKLAFGGDGPARGRVFVTCVTDERILIVLDGRAHPDPDFTSYTTIFVPTICGYCRAKSGYNAGIGGDFVVSDRMLERSAALQAIREWCDGGVEAARVMEDRDMIMAECKVYPVQFQMGEVVKGPEGKDVLRVLPYYDPKFA